MITDHTSKSGEPKLIKECTLPLTGKGVVNRIITDLGVFDVVDGGLEIIELAPGVERDEVYEKTAAKIVN